MYKRNKILSFLALFIVSAFLVSASGCGTSKTAKQTKNMVKKTGQNAAKTTKQTVNKTATNIGKVTKPIRKVTKPIDTRLGKPINKPIGKVVKPLKSTGNYVLAGVETGVSDLTGFVKKQDWKNATLKTNKMKQDLTKMKSSASAAGKLMINKMLATVGNIEKSIRLKDNKNAALHASKMSKHIKAYRKNILNKGNKVAGD